MTLSCLVAAIIFSTPTEPERTRGFELGASVAPAALPPASLALYGQLGAPDVTLGYRQGFSLLEFEARGVFNYLDLSFFADAGVRVPLFRFDRWLVAPGASLGLKWNSGNRYFDRLTFSGWSLRPRATMAASYLLQDTIQLIGTIEVPLALSFDLRAYQLTPTASGGAEFHLGSRISLSVLATIGADTLREPLGQPQTRLAWGLRLGVGYRLF